MNTSVSTIAAFRCARWPYQDTYRASLDAMQRRMIGVLMGWKPAAHEDLEMFRQRRHRLSSRLSAKHGKWGNCWASSSKKWGAHVYRNHDAASWSLSLLRFHDDGWLQQQRFLASGPGESRTNTRACRGKVHRRWEEGYSKL